MAAIDVERLIVQLSADVGGYERSLRQAGVATDRQARVIEGRFNRMNRTLTTSFARLGSALTSSIASFSLGLVSALSLQAVQSAVRNTIKSVADLGHEAERAGVSAEDLQALGFIAKQNDVAVSSLADALKNLNLEVGKAKTEQTDLGRIFAANNRSFSSNPFENFRTVADLIRNARTEQDKAVIGAAAFKTSYDELIPLLNLGAEAIAKGEQAARDTGAVIDEELVQKAKEFDAAWTAAWERWGAKSKGFILETLKGLQLITQHPGFFARRAGEQITGADLGSTEFRQKIGMTEAEAELFDLTKRRLTLEQDIQKAREAGLKTPLLESDIRQLEVVKQKITELQRTIELNRGPAFERSGRGGTAQPATVVPEKAAEKLDSAASHLETAIDKFARDVVAAESGGRVNAKNPLSTATGLGQFIESTWLRLFKQEFPDRAKGLSDAAILAFRTEAQTSFDLIKALARENAKALQTAGQTASEANLQLAHFLGAQGAVNVLKAAPGTPVSQVLPQNVINANQSVLLGKTTDDVIRYAEARTRAAEADKNAKTQFDELTSAQRANIGESQLEVDLFGQHTLAAEQMRIEYQLLAEAKRALGRELFPDEVAVIKANAAEMARLKVETQQLGEAQENAAQSAEQLAQAQQNAAQLAQEVEQAFSGALKGFISDLIHGKSLTDSLRDALTSLADQLISLALNNLFTPTGGAAGGGGIFGALFHRGGVVGAGGASRLVSPAVFAGAQRFHSGGFPGLGAGEVAAILKRGEIVIPDVATLRKMINRSGTATPVGGRPIEQTVINNFPTERAAQRSANQSARLNAIHLQRAVRVT